METVTITYGISCYPEAHADWDAPRWLAAHAATCSEAITLIGAATECDGSGTVATSDDLPMALTVTLTVPVTALRALLARHGSLLAGATVDCSAVASSDGNDLVDMISLVHEDLDWE